MGGSHSPAWTAVSFCLNLFVMVPHVFCSIGRERDWTSGALPCRVDDTARTLEDVDTEALLDDSQEPTNPRNKECSAADGANLRQGQAI